MHYENSQYMSSLDTTGLSSDIAEHNLVNNIEQGDNTGHTGENTAVHKKDGATHVGQSPVKTRREKKLAEAKEEQLAQARLLSETISSTIASSMQTVDTVSPDSKKARKENHAATTHLRNKQAELTSAH